MRDFEFIIDVDKRRPDDQRVWALQLPWNFETLMECLIIELSVKAISDVGGFFCEDLHGLLNRPDIVPHLKEKRRVDEPGYILFEPQNYKWLKLYIQYKVSDCRGEDTSNHLKEIEDVFENIQKRYKNFKIMTLQKQKKY
jgi:hypothetical protein